MAIQGIGSGAAGFGNIAANAMMQNDQSKVTSSVDSILNGDGPTTEAEIEEAATQMESLFASMLVKQMRGSMAKGFFGDGPGSDIYNEWFDKSIGDSIAAEGGLGMVGMLKVQLGIEAAIQSRESLEQQQGADSQDSAPVQGDQS
ncbi:MAG: Rod binding domain-containing protein [Bacteroidia bacterium]|jgi:Rod binding domain-containing protein